MDLTGFSSAPGLSLGPVSGRPSYVSRREDMGRLRVPSIRTVGPSDILHIESPSHAVKSAQEAAACVISAFKVSPKGLLGQGGMGCVLAGEHYEPRFQNVQLAYKVGLNPFPDGQRLADFGAHPMIPGQPKSAAELFVREAQMQMQLSSSSGNGAMRVPGIPSVFDIREAEFEGRYYPVIAMELIGGNTLEALIDEQRGLKASVEPLIDRLERVCRTVHCMHERELVHRDIKPANVLHDSILDVGFACRFGEPISAFHGTLEYAAPEQYPDRSKSQVVEASPLWDIYALGASLFHIVEGKPPNTHPDEDQMRQMLLRAAAGKNSFAGTSIYAGQAAQKFDIDLLNIIAKATNPDPAKRYQSALAFADDLKKRREGKPVQATLDLKRKPGQVSYSVGKFVNRNRWWTAGASALTIAVGGAGSYGVYSTKKAGEEKLVQNNLKNERQELTAFLDGVRQEITDGNFSQALSKLSPTVLRRFEAIAPEAEKVEVRALHEALLMWQALEADLTKAIVEPVLEWDRRCREHRKVEPFAFKSAEILPISDRWLVSSKEGLTSPVLDAVGALEKLPPLLVESLAEHLITLGYLRIWSIDPETDQKIRDWSGTGFPEEYKDKEARRKFELNVGIFEEEIKKLEAFSSRMVGVRVTSSTHYYLMRIASVHRLLAESEDERRLIDQGATIHVKNFQSVSTASKRDIIVVCLSRIRNNIWDSAYTAASIAETIKPASAIATCLKAVIANRRVDLSAGSTTKSRWLAESSESFSKSRTLDPKNKNIDIAALRAILSLARHQVTLAPAKRDFPESVSKAALSLIGQVETLTNIEESLCLAGLRASILERPYDKETLDLATLLEKRFPTSTGIMICKYYLFAKNQNLGNDQTLDFEELALQSSDDLDKLMLTSIAGSIFGLSSDDEEKREKCLQFVLMTVKSVLEKDPSWSNFISVDAQAGQPLRHISSKDNGLLAYLKKAMARTTNLNP